MPHPTRLSTSMSTPTSTATSTATSATASTKAAPPGSRRRRRLPFLSRQLPPDAHAHAPAAASSTSSSTDHLPPSAWAGTPGAALETTDFAEFMAQAERQARQRESAWRQSLESRTGSSFRLSPDNRPAGTLTKLFARRRQASPAPLEPERPQSLRHTSRHVHTPASAPAHAPTTDSSIRIPVPLEDMMAFPGHLPLTDDERSQVQMLEPQADEEASIELGPDSRTRPSSTVSNDSIVDPDLRAFREALSSMLAASQQTPESEHWGPDEGQGTSTHKPAGLYAHPIYERSGESLALSHVSAVSGRANSRLDEPLLELEQIEVDEFLKSFGKYTRQIDIPGAGSAVKSRMPQWSDFRVPHDEARRIAEGQQGNSLITHIDRGLRAMLAEETEGNIAVQPDLHRRRRPAPTGPAQARRPKNQKRASFQAVLSKAKSHDVEHPPPDPPPLSTSPDEADGSEETVDGVAFVIAYLLALLERYAPHELDNSPNAGYRESVSRTHLMRLYVIAPFWEQFFLDIQALLTWRNPRRTSGAAMAYFILWYTDFLPTAFFLYLIYHVCRFRFFPPEISVVRNNVLRRMRRSAEAEKVSERLRRQSRLDILHIYKLWIDAFGAPTQMLLGDLADLHEKVKSLILWRNPLATKRTIGLLTLCGAWVTLADAHTVWRAVLFGIGLCAFGLFPLHFYYPRYRRPLNPIWWVLWGCPTDAQFAISILRERHERELQADTARQQQIANLKRRRPKGRNKSSATATDTLDPAATATDDADDSVARDGLKESATALETPSQIDDPPPGSTATESDSVNIARPAVGPGFLGTSTRSGTAAGPIIDRDRGDTPLATAQTHKLGSFFCQHKHVPGFLHVTDQGIHFVGLHTTVARAPARPFVGQDRFTPAPLDADSGGSSENLQAAEAAEHDRRSHTHVTPFGHIATLVKTKSTRLFLWQSLGLQLVRIDGKTVSFANMTQRDRAFNLILAACSRTLDP